MKNIDIKNETRLALDNVEYIYNDGMELVEQADKVTPEQINELAMEALNYIENSQEGVTFGALDLCDAMQTAKQWIKENKEEA